MVAKDYRLLKIKDVVEININDLKQIEYLRPGYNMITGKVSQIRSDMIDVIFLQERKTELLEEVKDIDAMLEDINSALEAKLLEEAKALEEEIIP